VYFSCEVKVVIVSLIPEELIVNGKVRSVAERVCPVGLKLKDEIVRNTLVHAGNVVVPLIKITCVTRGSAASSGIYRLAIRTECSLYNPCLDSTALAIILEVRVPTGGAIRFKVPDVSRKCNL
jgi:hypothetical protein